MNYVMRLIYKDYARYSRQKDLFAHYVTRYCNKKHPYIGTYGEFIKKHAVSGGRR